MLFLFFFDSKRSNGALNNSMSNNDKEEHQPSCIPFRDKENRLELELTLDREVLDGEMVFPVV